MKSNLRSLLSLPIAIFLIFSQAMLGSSAAKAEDCPTYDLAGLFAEEYFPNLKWDNLSGLRTIKWSPFAKNVNGVAIARDFTADEMEYLRISFDSWDVALRSIMFQKVDDPTTADVLIGITPLNDNGFWTVKASEGIRKSGTIQISSTTPIILTREGFIEVTQSEIGNLLGLGDIRKKIDFDSVMLEPDLPPFGEEALNDFDIGMIRQFYGESTCKSAWPEELLKSKADWEAAKVRALAAAQAKADAEAAAKAKAELEAAAKAKAEAEAKARAELEAQKASASKKKKTITCVKGKTTKKVTAVNPSCPKGFVKK